MGPGLPGGPLGGLLVVALITMMLGASLGCVLYQHRLGTLLRRVKVRIRPRPVQPAGPPLEQIASGVRRLRAEIRSVPPGTPIVRRVALTRAYDDLLADACHALDVPDTLSDLLPGAERDAERLHVEVELEEAGLRLSA